MRGLAQSNYDESAARGIDVYFIQKRRGVIFEYSPM